MVNVGPLEIVLVAIIALIVLGPQRLPEMARSVGRGMREFRQALSDAGSGDDEGDEDEPGDEDDLDPELVDDEAPPPLPTEPPGSPAGDPAAAAEDLPEGR